MLQTDTHLGPVAGVATSLLWTVTALLFTAAGRRISPTLVNGSRIYFGIVLLAITHRLLAGAWLPHATPGQVALLLASGVIGLSFGDQALFTAFVEIGPRLSMLIMTTSPLFAVAFGWVVLGERLPGVALLGIGLTVGGVAWVVLERQPVGADVLGGRRARGVLLAFVAAACQAGGLLLSKQGMGHGWLTEDQHMTPQAATLVRMLGAGIGVLPLLWWHETRSRGARAGVRTSCRRSRRTGYALAACGAFVGPYLGVWMSLVAADLTDVGIAQTLCSLAPIF
ncbi:MAG: DMT family transporter, partial [Phycisphaerae bacterium]